MNVFVSEERLHNSFCDDISQFLLVETQQEISLKGLIFRGRIEIDLSPFFFWAFQNDWSLFAEKESDELVFNVVF